MSLSNIVMFVFIILIFYYFMIKPEVKRKMNFGKQNIEKMGINEDEKNTLLILYEEYNKKLGSYYFLSMIGIIVIIFFVGTLILYIWKTTQMAWLPPSPDGIAMCQDSDVCSH